MTRNASFVGRRLKTPRAAAIAGIIFSVLLFVFFWLFRTAVPSDPNDPGAWLRSDSASVAMSLYVVPVAGVAFLWFIGVLRDRLGGMEDQFFATVLLGSALLFLAMLFVSAAALGATILIFPTEPGLIDSATFHFARAIAHTIANVYALKMAAVFMISTSTVALQTSFVPRWITVLGFVFGLFILFGSYYLSWSFVVLPIWVLLLSVHILIDNLRAAPSGFWRPDDMKIQDASKMMKS